VISTSCSAFDEDHHAEWPVRQKLEPKASQSIYIDQKLIAFSYNDVSYTAEIGDGRYQETPRQAKCTARIPL
jgi:hypothetical protein